MNKVKKVLYISQEIYPYLPETEMSKMGRYLPQAAQERGRETRTFMPKFGLINERRNQLHEVIRLSGMNLIIDDTDHPLIIKVASIQSARLQVYFIDNEDYFQRRCLTTDENGVEYADNDERIIFYARGVLETVKKVTLDTRHHTLPGMDDRLGPAIHQKGVCGRSVLQEIENRVLRVR